MRASKSEGYQQIMKALLLMQSLQSLRGQSHLVEAEDVQQPLRLWSLAALSNSGGPVTDTQIFGYSRLQGLNVALRDSNVEGRAS